MSEHPHDQDIQDREAPAERPSPASNGVPQTGGGIIPSGGNQEPAPGVAGTDDAKRRENRVE